MKKLFINETARNKDKYLITHALNRLLHQMASYGTCYFKFQEKDVRSFQKYMSVKITGYNITVCDCVCMCA